MSGKPAAAKVIDGGKPKAPLPAAKPAATAAAPAAPAVAPAAAKPAAAAPVAAKPAAKAAAAVPAAKAAVAAPVAVAAKVAAAPAKPAAKAAKAAAPAVPANGTEMAAGEAAVAAPKKQRKQMAQVLGTQIPPARVASTLKRSLQIPEIEEQVAPLTEQIRVIKAAAVAAGTGDAPETKEAIKAVREQINALRKGTTRMSMRASYAMTVIMDLVTRDLIRFGVANAEAAGKTRVEVEHLHADDDSASELVYYPLFSRLDSWAQYSPEDEAQAREQRTAEARTARDARRARKEADGVAEADADAEADDVVEGAEGGENGEGGKTSKTTFYTYIDNSIKTIKKELGEEGATTSAFKFTVRVREHLADMVLQAIDKLRVLALILVKSEKVRTINDDHVVNAVHVLLTNADRSEADIEAALIAPVSEAIRVSEAYAKAEKAKKEAALTDEKRELIQQKADLTNQERAAKKHARLVSQYADVTAALGLPAVTVTA